MSDPFVSEERPEVLTTNYDSIHLAEYILGAQPAVADFYFSSQPERVYRYQQSIEEPTNVAWHWWEATIQRLVERHPNHRGSVLEISVVKEIIVESAKLAYEQAQRVGLPVPLHLPLKFQQLGAEVWDQIHELFLDPVQTQADQTSATFEDLPESAQQWIRRTQIGKKALGSPAYPPHYKGC